jgi:hypothetical protein
MLFAEFQSNAKYMNSTSRVTTIYILFSSYTYLYHNLVPVQRAAQPIIHFRSLIKYVNANPWNRAACVTKGARCNNETAVFPQHS